MKVAIEICEEFAEQWEKQARGGDNTGASDHRAEAARQIIAELRNVNAAPTVVVLDDERAALPDEVRHALTHAIGGWRGAACGTRDDEEGERRSADYRRRAQVIEDWLAASPQATATQPSPTAVVLDDEREAFIVHWCKDVPEAHREDAKRNVRAYLQEGTASDRLAEAWAAWQARAASPQPVAQPVEQTQSMEKNTVDDFVFKNHQRLLFLAADIEDSNVRKARDDLLDRMATMTYSAVCLQIEAILKEHGLSLNPLGADAARPRSISDEIMDLVDRLGHEWKDVDPRAWSRLLIYAPQPVEQTRADSLELARMLWNEWLKLRGTDIDFKSHKVAIELVRYASRILDAALFFG